MIRFEFKQLKLRNGQPFDYKKQLSDIILNVAPLDGQGNQKRGFNKDDIGEAEALAKKIEAGNGFVELTAAEMMHIHGKVQNVAWPYADAAFAQLVEDVDQAANA
jgi:hypothetical protein